MDPIGLKESSQLIGTQDKDVVELELRKRTAKHFEKENIYLCIFNNLLKFQKQ